MQDAFTLSWEEMVDIYETYCDCMDSDWEFTDKDMKLFERLQEALKPRNVVEG